MCSPSIKLIESIMLPAVADVLIDAASVLGGDATLKILYVKLCEVCITYFDTLIISFVFVERRVAF